MIAGLGVDEVETLPIGKWGPIMNASNKDGRIEDEEILQDFLYSYRQLDVTALKVYDALTNIYAAIELLVAKGIIGIEELDERKKLVERRMTRNFQEAELGVLIQDILADKYDLEEPAIVNCKERMHLCKVACCTMAFALSWQDIQEGVRWSLGRPFLCAKGADGYCIHLNRQNFECLIYDNRPAICRTYDCCHDERIWLDYDKMIINPDLAEEGLPSSIDGPTAKVGFVSERAK